MDPACRRRSQARYFRWDSDSSLRGRHVWAYWQLLCTFSVIVMPCGLASRAPKACNLDLPTVLPFCTIYETLSKEESWLPNPDRPSGIRQRLVYSTSADLPGTRVVLSIAIVAVYNEEQFRDRRLSIWRKGNSDCWKDLEAQSGIVPGGPSVNDRYDRWRRRMGRPGSKDASRMDKLTIVKVSQTPVPCLVDPNHLVFLAAA
jgi:hypothetical protein